MVYLIGAGPGDAGLLTVKAMEALKQAKVVIYDHLADARILRHAEGAEFIYVGKESCKHTMKQEDISQLIADKAEEIGAENVVVRLKGGDPFVFGRGGEEALVLKERKIPYEIVPGVTSAIAVPAYAGIPVTHRGIATSFAVITGHEDPKKGASNMRWDKLATATDTLVFLMGVANLPKITAELIAHGRAADTPAALIRWGTKTEQEVLETTVEHAVEDVKKHGLKPPAIFIVGEVAKLRRELAWFDIPAQRPLFGKKILVTRARAQASELTEKLEALGADCMELPSITLEAPSDNFLALDQAMENIADYPWIIFTSRNAVARFFDRFYAKGKDARAFAYAKVAAIGTATAEELKNYGIVADVVPTVFRAEGILDALKDKLPARAKILIPRAEKAREILPETLRNEGHTVDVPAVYQTVQAEADGAALAEKLRAGKIDWVTFTSSSTVENLVKILEGGTALQKVKVACIGPVTAETSKKLGITPTIVADNYTIQGLVEAITSEQG